LQTKPTAGVKPSPAQTPASAAQPASKQKTVAGDEVVERSAPQVSKSAQRTIHGKIKVRVRVAVDASGNVTEAKLKDAGPSEYFARAALEAARRWKFAPEPDQNRRDWTLLFAFGRGKTEMSASHGR
jgi:TonB family protein